MPRGLGEPQDDHLESLRRTSRHGAEVFVASFGEREALNTISDIA